MSAKANEGITRDRTGNLLPDIKLVAPEVPLCLRIAGFASRALFIVVMVVLVAHVSGFQSETIWSAYETPADLIRVVVGLVASPADLPEQGI